MSEPTFERTLNANQVANCCQVTRQALSLWRARDFGPAWRRNPELPRQQQIEYDRDDVVAFAARRRKMISGAYVPQRDLDAEIRAAMVALG